MFGTKTRQIDRLKEELRLSQEQNQNAQETLRKINEARKRDVEQADIKISVLKDKITNLEAEKQALFEASKADYEKLNKEVERLRKYERNRDKRTGKFVSRKAQKPETKTSEWCPAPEDKSFKVGNKVKIVDGFEPEKWRKSTQTPSGIPFSFTSYMDKFIRRPGIVRGFRDEIFPIVEFEGNDNYAYTFRPEWLEHAK